MGLYFHHRSSFAHDTGSHPESAMRIEAIERTLGEAGWPGLERVEPTLAPRAWLERVHTPAHVDRIEEAGAAGAGAIDPETIVSEGSWEAALHAAGAAAEGAERLLSGEADVAFCALRPPGHHAESARAMGFCLFNNAAVGAAHAIDACGAERVLIFDWDVHHGNGTEEIFAARGDVLYVSTHESPLYPGTGPASEIGHGEGAGLTVNLPVPAGTDGTGFRGLTDHVVAPLARRFAPQLIVVSAGYDAHARDPLARCELTAADFGAMSASIRELGRELDAPVLVCLEGGYAPVALADSVLGTVLAFAEPRPVTAVEPDAMVREAQRRIGALDPWRGAFSS